MTPSVPKILITGASGFIGNHLISAFGKETFKLVCVSRKDTDTKISTDNVRWITIPDFCDATQWHQATRGIDYIVHLAALAHQVGDTSLNINDYRRANTIPTKLIAKAASGNGVKRIVFISSVAAVGTPRAGDILSDVSLPAPDSPYGVSKLEAEAELANILSGSTTTDWISLRPCLVYGPGNPGNMDRIARLVALRIPLPFGNIKNRRSFLYVENLTSAILTSLKERSLSRKTYLLSDDETLSTLELARLISNAKGSRLKSFSIPNAVLKVAAIGGDLIKSVTGRGIGIDSYSLEKLKTSLRIDNTRFKKDANWQPPYTPTKGIYRTFSTPTK